MFRLIAFTLAATLCLPAEAFAKSDLRASARRVSKGGVVRIQTLAQKTVQGRLAEVTSDGVTLAVIENYRINEKYQITERIVPFAEMKSIKEINRLVPSNPLVRIAEAIVYLFCLPFVMRRVVL